jgi:methionyl-tRNA formyltransferase
MSVRVAFLGNDPWSVPVLEALVGEPETELVLVVTNPPRPAGRGNELRATAVADAARAHGLPLVEVERVSSGPGSAAIHEVAPDVVVVVAYGELVGPDILDLAPLGAVNVHFSLLPRWRGAAPVQHAILAGDERTGVTVMRMDAGLDTGPILGTLEDEIRPEDDAGSLGERLAHLGGMLLVGVIRQLAAEGLPARPQDDRKATWAPKLGADERLVRWEDEAEAIVRRVRALSPEPGAVTSFRGDPIKILAAAVGHDDAGERPPGTIVAADGRGVAVATGAGVVRLLEVAPAGRRRMSAAGWANGARFVDVERLGA